MSWGVSHLLALLTGFCLDLLLGDPHWAPHPVRAVGVLIAALEKCEQTEDVSYILENREYLSKKLSLIHI